MSQVENQIDTSLPLKSKNIVSSIMSKMSIKETDAKSLEFSQDQTDERSTILQKILKGHISKRKLHKKKDLTRVTSPNTLDKINIPKPTHPNVNQATETILISKSTISKIKSNLSELHEKDSMQQQEIEKLKQLLEESNEREKFAKEAAQSQKTRMEKIISTLQTNLFVLEHEMTKKSIEDSKSAKDKIGALEVDLVKQKLISKSLYEQIDSLKARQDSDRKKITSLLKKQAVISASYQETNTKLIQENKKLKKCFEIVANSNLE